MASTFCETTTFNSKHLQSFQRHFIIKKSLNTRKMKYEHKGIYMCVCVCVCVCVSPHFVRVAWYHYCLYGNGWQRNDMLTSWDIKNSDTILVRKPQQKGPHGSLERIKIKLQVVSWCDNVDLIQLVQDVVKILTLISGGVEPPSSIGRLHNLAEWDHGDGGELGVPGTIQFSRCYQNPTFAEAHSLEFAMSDYWECQITGLWTIGDTLYVVILIFFIQIMVNL
jgi:hypothetical protein